MLERLQNRRADALRIEKAGSPTAEVKQLRATVQVASYKPALQHNYGQISIKNLSPMVAIEFTLDNAWPALTADKAASGVLFRLGPGQVMTFAAQPREMLYRSCAGIALIQIVCGMACEMHPQTPTNAFFSEIDAMPWQFLAADRKSKDVYANDGLQTYYSPDGGRTWQKKYLWPAWAPAVAFITREGTLLLATTDQKLWRSTDKGATFTLVLDNLPGNGWLGGTGIAQQRDAANSPIIFGDYQIGQNDAAIRRSVNDGQTWDVVLQRTRAQIRHWHTILVDPYTGGWLATSGDGDDEVEWWNGNSAGTAWTPIVGARNGSGINGSQMWRTCGVIFTPDGYLWGMDADADYYGESCMVIGSRANMAAAKKSLVLPGPVMGAYQHGELWALVVTAIGNVSHGLDNGILVSTDMGVTWKTAFEWPGTASNIWFNGFQQFPSQEGYMWLRMGKDIEGTYGAGGGLVPVNYYTLRVKR